MKSSEKEMNLEKIRDNKKKFVPNKKNKMKSVFYRIMVIAVVAISFASCEKINDIENNKMNNAEEMVLKQQDISSLRYANGHILQLQWNGSHFNEVEVGTYMRTFYSSETLKGFIYGVGCYSPVGGCLPDIDVYGAIPIIDGISEEEHYLVSEIQYLNIDKETSEQINKIYSIPLKEAIKKGDNAIKEFFLNNFIYRTEVPEKMIEDFKNDKLTIKQFPEGLFVVNKDAQNYKDVPNYFNIK
ncbi:MAG: hypothetical protein LBV69_00550 [Bacteroidales bacterium]|jgi:hypothetical protein|nr:hypothetical protein [Bacteroidales bacterium]